jgi:hypothetical protein
MLAKNYKLTLFCLASLVVLMSIVAAQAAEKAHSDWREAVCVHDGCAGLYLLLPLGLYAGRTIYPNGSDQS